MQMIKSEHHSNLARHHSRGLQQVPRALAFIGTLHSMLYLLVPLELLLQLLPVADEAGGGVEEVASVHVK